MVLVLSCFAEVSNVLKMRSTDKAAARFYPETLSIYGNWLAETRSENPNIIMENYMEKVIASSLLVDAIWCCQYF